MSPYLIKQQWFETEIIVNFGQIYPFPTKQKKKKDNSPLTLIHEISLL